MIVNPKRLYALNHHPPANGPAVYWMSRDQRAADNWALLFAQSFVRNRPLQVIFSLAPGFLEAPWRPYAFLLDGLQEVRQDLAAKNISFHLLVGDPGETVPAFITREKAGVLVTDFDPLKLKQHWVRTVARRVSCSFYEVDSHNIVPCRRVSNKQEYAARTIRPKIHRLLPEFLTPLPRLKKEPALPEPLPGPDMDRGSLADRLRVNTAIAPVAGVPPGAKAARRRLRDFIHYRLSRYHTHRNDPNQQAVSGLSPYLHFGHISAQRIALEVRRAEAPAEAIEAFLEELIVRRELADNFCFYNSQYDNISGFPDWARRTLADHEDDPREYLYTPAELAAGNTHDDLWNAAQLEMVCHGTMPGYLRMYWAKKILEWSPDAAGALATAISLNNTYQLDGRDPNGYTGIAWSLGGVHDRPWQERAVFGKLRYMNQNGCRRKFDVDAYIRRIRQSLPDTSSATATANKQ